MKITKFIFIALLITACAEDPGDLTESTHSNIDKINAEGEVCENGIEKTINCGINNRGIQTLACVSGIWTNKDDCVDSDECVDEETREMEKGCGLNGEGIQPQICADGKWENTGTCADPDECTNDDIQKVPCGFNNRGEKPQKCVDGKWADDGECIDPDECVDGDKKIGMTPCGISDISFFEKKCSEGHWEDTEICVCDGEIFSHYQKGLCWSDQTPDAMNWSSAVNYCDGLKGRLPSISELRTLIQNCPSTMTDGECGVTDSCLLGTCLNDPCYGCSHEDNGKYSVFGNKERIWSVSVHSSGASSAWLVSFNTGGVYNFGKENAYFVLCVK